MNIACVGWGSLCWKPDGLPLASSVWNRNGPILPLEFARQSKDDRITLVIAPDGTPCQTLWAMLAAESIAQATEALRKREGTIGRFIGFWSEIENSGHAECDIVSDWARQFGLDGAVWTALPPKFRDAEVTPSEQEVLSHLEALEGEARDRAEEYVRNAPRQIKTKYREAIEARLGWIRP